MLYDTTKYYREYRTSCSFLGEILGTYERQLCPQKSTVVFYFGIVPSNEVTETLNQISNGFTNPSSQFTCEIERLKYIAVHYLHIFKNPDGTEHFCFCRKPTKTDCSLHFNSRHSMT